MELEPISPEVKKGPHLLFLDCSFQMWDNNKIPK